VSAPLTANIRFFYADFVVSTIVFEDDFEDSNDSLLAPPSQNHPPNKYLIIIFQTIIIHNGKNQFKKK
jgi:hypothetical protein